MKLKVLGCYGGNIPGHGMTSLLLNDTVAMDAGYVVEDKDGAIAFSSDTGPTQRFWEIVNATRKLKAVITETSFPNELQDLAHVSGHLTPATLDLELRKLKAKVPVYLYGGKPKHLRTIRQQVKALKRSEVKFFTQGKVYHF
jgi:3',5'-cyclic-nucleotide phosphodiesterase